VDVVYFLIHEIKPFHPLGESSILLELALSQDSALLSCVQPADVGGKLAIDNRSIHGNIFKLKSVNLLCCIGGEGNVCFYHFAASPMQSAVWAAEFQ
jgi:hypothetical protein